MEKEPENKLSAYVRSAYPVHVVRDVDGFPMYCLQLILPLLILPKPSNPAAHLHHAIYILLFLITFFLERKPCGVCTFILLLFVFLPCFTLVDNLCLFSSCSAIYMP
ncbi:hypothetical protein SprV_0301213800 [Sparganum proliferum]